MMIGKWLFFIVFVLAGVALDQWSKQWALANLQYAQTQEAWNGMLLLTLSFNKGAAFGLNLGAASRGIFIVFILVTVTWLTVVYHRTHGDGLRRLGLSLVCAGALGNLTDRIASGDGVVDFLGPYDLGFMLWPIFNVADIWVVLGIASLFISMSRGRAHPSQHPTEPLVPLVASKSKTMSSLMPSQEEQAP
jgi:signal peptidase II